MVFGGLFQREDRERVDRGRVCGGCRSAVILRTGILQPVYQQDLGWKVGDGQSKDCFGWV